MTLDSTLASARSLLDECRALLSRALEAVACGDEDEARRLLARLGDVVAQAEASCSDGERATFEGLRALAGNATAWVNTRVSTAAVAN